MYRRFSILGLPFILGAALLLVLQATLAQGGLSPHQTESSPPRFLTVSPAKTAILHPVDIDYDGDLDIFSSGLVDGQLIWYENQGVSKPEFTIRTLGTSFDYVQALEMADLDGDGHLDVLVGAATVKAIYWYENQGGTPITFVEHLAALDVSVPRSVKTADVVAIDGFGTVLHILQTTRLHWVRKCVVFPLVV